MPNHQKLPSRVVPPSKLENGTDKVKEIKEKKISHTTDLVNPLQILDILPFFVGKKSQT